MIHVMLSPKGLVPQVFRCFFGSFWWFDAFVSGLFPFELTTFANDLAI